MAGYIGLKVSVYDHQIKGVFVMDDDLKIVDGYGVINAGAGANLDETSALAYLETPHGRVALIATVSTMGIPLSASISAMAGKQSRRFPGRPGVNGLRIDEYIEVTQEQLTTIQQNRKGPLRNERLATVPFLDFISSAYAKMCCLCSAYFYNSLH